MVGVLDLTVGGQLAQSCLTKIIPYLGFGLRETHAVELEKYLTMWVKDNMGTERPPHSAGRELLFPRPRLPQRQTSRRTSHPRTDKI